MVHEGLNNLRKGYTHEYTSNILAIIFLLKSHYVLPQLITQLWQLMTRYYYVIDFLINLW